MTDIDSLRLLIPDPESADSVFTDDDLGVFLSLSGNKVFLAAAMALETIATDETLVYKIVTTDDLSVNGVSGAAQVLLVRAKTLRADQVRADQEADAADAFSLVFPLSPFRTYPEAAAPWFC